MSADNGIYIARFPEGYRVIEAAAIENIDYYPEGTLRRKIELKRYFGKAPLFLHRPDAFEYAYKLKEKVLNDPVFPVLEYGVCYIGEYESFNGV